MNGTDATVVEGDAKPDWRGPGRLIVVSHRGPGGTGGVAAALDPVLTASRGVWVASDGLSRPYEVYRVHLGAPEQERYYRGYANGGLWPLCHSLVERSLFRAADWETYHAVNLRFARAAAEVAAPGDTVWVHDYQLALVPRLLRELRPDLPDLSIAFFWHIPWPPADVWRLCPHGEQIVDGMLAADLIGFHIPAYVRNFRACIRPGAALRGTAHALPIGVDFRRIDRLAASATTARNAARIKRVLGLDGVRIGVGVDRLDYTKGVPQRLEAITALFEHHPELRGRLTFVQVAAATRTGIEQYRRLRSSVQVAAARLNTRFGAGRWQPVRLIGRRLGLTAIVTLYRMADFALVSPLYDGMNLVAKEFVAARGDERGVLLLSHTAGAAAELEEAVPVNPLDPDGTAEAIWQAIGMDPAEQAQRMAALRAKVAENDVHRWAADNLRSLALTGERLVSLN